MREGPTGGSCVLVAFTVETARGDALPLAGRRSAGIISHPNPKCSRRKVKEKWIPPCPISNHRNERQLVVAGFQVHGAVTPWSVLVCPAPCLLASTSSSSKWSNWRMGWWTPSPTRPYRQTLCQARRRAVAAPRHGPSRGGDDPCRRPCQAPVHPSKPLRRRGVEVCPTRGGRFYQNRRGGPGKCPVGCPSSGRRVRVC